MKLFDLPYHLININVTRNITLVTCTTELLLKDKIL